MKIVLLVLLCFLLTVFISSQDNPATTRGNSGNARVWWKEAVVYQIYPRSFKDSNGTASGTCAESFQNSII